MNKIFKMSDSFAKDQADATAMLIYCVIGTFLTMGIALSWFLAFGIALLLGSFLAVRLVIYHVIKYRQHYGNDYFKQLFSRK